MRNQKVVMIGFSERIMLLFSPLVRQLYCVEDVTYCATIDDLKHCTDMVDSLFLCASYLGFDIEPKIASLRASHPGVQIVVLALHSMSQYMGKLIIRSGVDILFANVEDRNEYKKLQNAVENNLKYYPPNVRAAFNDEVLRDEPGFLNIPARERECLHLTMKGLAVKEIANEMGITIGTVGNLRKRTMKRLGAHSFIELIHMSFVYNYGTSGEYDYVV
jgi:DNA-binding CsgD family transcriptional regulator